MTRRKESEKKDEQARPMTESQRQQQGGPAVSSRHIEKHEKDESGGRTRKNNQEAAEQCLTNVNQRSEYMATTGKIRGPKEGKPIKVTNKQDANYQTREKRQQKQIGAKKK